MLSTELLSVDTEIHTQDSAMSMGHSATDGREPEATFRIPVEDVLVNTLPCLSNCGWHFVQGALETNPVHDDFSSNMVYLLKVVILTMSSNKHVRAGVWTL